MRIDRAQLASRIAACKAEPRYYSDHLVVASVVDEWNLKELVDVMGKVNRESFCGADPETLLLRNFRTSHEVPHPGDIVLVFYYKHEGWNTIFHGEYVWRFHAPYIPYPPIDFNALFPESESWRDRPPLL